MTDEELFKAMDEAITRFSGQASDIENAIGMLMVGRRYGWKVMYLVHSKRTIAKYEKILGLKIQEALPETADRTHKSLAWIAVQKVGNYWKAVKGEIPGIKSQELKK